MLQAPAARVGKIPASRRIRRWYLFLVAAQLTASVAGLIASHHLRQTYDNVVQLHQVWSRDQAIVAEFMTLAERAAKANNGTPDSATGAAASVAHALSLDLARSLVDVSNRIMAGTPGNPEPLLSDLNAARATGEAWITAEERAQQRAYEIASSDPAHRRDARAAGVNSRSVYVQLLPLANALRTDIDQLDATSMESLRQAQSFRDAKNGIEAATILCILGVLICTVLLFREMNHEEEKHSRIELAVRSERLALGHRVDMRTAELKAEVDERRRMEELNRGRNQVLEMLARNADLPVLLNSLVSVIGNSYSSWQCALHLVEQPYLNLTASSGVSAPLMARIQRLACGFNDAPECVALASGHVTVVADLSTARRPWTELLRAHNVQSVWSAPFFASDGSALGTVTNYSALLHTPTERDLELLEMACNMATLVFEHRRLHERLVDHAYRDSLTGIPNRRLGEDRLGQALSRAQRSNQLVAVLWLDLDRFKQINDVHGHPVGDAVLQQIAKRLATRLRAHDTLARMGGDEFMAVIEEVPDRANAELLARELRDSLLEPIRLGALKLTVEVSIGVSIYPEDGETVDLLASNADHAMYQAKHGRHGVQCFAPSISHAAMERRDLLEELARAYEQDQFELDYQPQCTPAGKLVGFEALLRFRHSRLGDVRPERFIPLAEDSQLIIPIGSWVLRETCRQALAWKSVGLKIVPVAVNISALQFTREDFADTVAAILAESGFDPSLLQLELTESLVMGDFAESARQMKRLKKLGIRIAIDDFGTGYSSLSYLHRLPIDVLKIDRSFVEKLTAPDGTRPIVEAVLSMAHTLKLRVVAEGVEDQQQMAILEQIGCDVLQGYYFSGPVRPVQAANYLALRSIAPGSHAHAELPAFVEPVRL